MLLRTLAAIGIGTGCLLAANETKQEGSKQRIEASNTQRLDFPSGGAIRLRNSSGGLTVEAWDRPDVEITTVKSTKGEYGSKDRDKEMRKLDKVHVAVERQGNELIVTTDYLRYRAFLPPYPIGGKPTFDLEELTRRTGGVQITVRNHAEITEAATRIGRILRDQYLIGFVPDAPQDNGKWHSIKVSVKAEGAKAYTRSGFYAR